MGGVGSGRRWSGGGRNTVEAHPSIDANLMNREKRLRPGTWGVWRAPGEGYDIGYSTSEEGLRLAFEVSASGVEAVSCPGHPAGLAGRLPVPRPPAIPFQKSPWLPWDLLKVRPQLFVHRLLDEGFNLRVQQLVLGLTFKLRLGNLHADDRDQTLGTSSPLGNGLSFNRFADSA